MSARPGSTVKDCGKKFLLRAEIADVLAHIVVNRGHAQPEHQARRGHAVSAACAALEAALPKEVAGFEVHAFEGAVLVPTVGVVIKLSLLDQATDRWCGGEVVAIDASKLSAYDVAPEAEIERFVRALTRLTSPRKKALAIQGDLAEALGLDAPQYPDKVFAATPEDDARRAAALRDIEPRFEAVATRMREAYGLRLPRHVGVLAAFVRGLSPLEQRAFDHHGYSCAGILDWFLDGGFDLKPTDGADFRLHWRFRCDPPEFVSVLHGGSDGLHFGLWYDDPAELPSFAVENYGRDDGVTKGYGCTTMIQHLRRRLDQHEELASEPLSALHRVLRAALDAAGPADDAAVAADGPLRWARCQRPPCVAGIGPALPGGPAEALFPSCEEESVREARYRLRALQVGRYVREARAALVSGRPGPALLVGRELFWNSDPCYDADVLDLLAGAYVALGRGALADILRVHMAGRNRPFVSIYME